MLDWRHGTYRPRGLITTTQLIEARAHLEAGLRPARVGQRLLAATLRAGDGAAASHLAAAWAWGFDGVIPTGIELSVSGDRQVRVGDVCVHRVGDLLPVDVTTRGPQPVTTPARTLLDIAAYDDQRLVAEVGGHGSHSTRRQRQADAERRARLTAMGLRVVDFTYEDVNERPPYVATTLGELLGLVPYLDGLSA